MHTQNNMKRLACIAILVFAGLTSCFAQIGGNHITWNGEFKDGKFVLTGTPDRSINHISGTVSAMPCAGDKCFAPEEWSFDLSVTDEAPAEEPQIQEPEPEVLAEPEPTAAEVSVAPAQSPEPETGSLWALILEAILWGLAMLLTPCVFPMVPMTVSFFIKGSEDKRRGRFRALVYGLFIVLLYTVPICIIIGSTWLLGGASVTADIFNWLSTHWLPNIIFFLVFLAFALSFFGLFEIVLPARWVNSADRNSNRKGLGGIFFMALTLVLVSFSCTGPIVGTVLIKSTSGEFWAPMVTMLAFSLAFALPFVLLALFPSVLKNLPRSGGWMQTVKISLGFIELALGLKFLSIADQTYHWGILPRNVYLVIWIVLFCLLALYLLGLLRFKSDGEGKVHFSVARVIWLVIVSAFTLYLISGLYGNPLKALSGYLPPAEQSASTGKADDTFARELTVGQDMSFEQALQEAKRLGRPVFLDITGYGCVNCREMEARVWTDAEVKRTLDENFLVVKLYMDDKTELPESQWVTTEEGHVLKDAGRVNSYLALKKFGVNAMPNYFILDSEGNIIKGPYAYNPSISDFLNFLR